MQEGQVAVVTQFGKYKSTSQAGFQWRLPYPIQSHETVNVSQLRTFEVGFRGGARNKVLPEALMLTTDENIVDMQFVVQYRLRADGAPDYLFMTRDPDESVRQASETAMREIVGKQTMDFVLYEGRTTVASQVQALMQQILDRYQTGIQVSTVAIQNVQPPEQVQAAFDDAVKAGQDRERQINEGQAYANQVVPLASGQASRMQEQAEGYKAKVIGDAQGNTARFTSILGEYEGAGGHAPAHVPGEHAGDLHARQQGHGRYQEQQQHVVSAPGQDHAPGRPGRRQVRRCRRLGFVLAGQSAVPAAAASGAVPAAPSSGSSNSNTLPRDRASR